MSPQTGQADPAGWLDAWAAIAVATTGSPNTLPHSPSERLEVIRIDPRSQHRDTSWKNRCAALASNGR